MAEKKDESRLKELLLREKPSLILLGLKNSQGKKYASILSKEANCTYSHAIKILQELDDLDIIETRKEGRIKYLSLTPKGEDVSYALESLIRVISKSRE